VRGGGGPEEEAEKAAREKAARETGAAQALVAETGAAQAVVDPDTAAVVDPDTAAVVDPEAAEVDPEAAVVSDAAVNQQDGEQNQANDDAIEAQATIVNDIIKKSTTLTEALKKHSEFKDAIEASPIAGIGISFLETYFPKSAEKFAGFLEKNHGKIAELLKKTGNDVDITNFRKGINAIVINQKEELGLTEYELKTFETEFSDEGLQGQINSIKDKAKSSSKKISLENDGVVVGNNKPDGTGEKMACIAYVDQYNNNGGKRKSKTKSKKAKKSKKTKSKKAKKSIKKENP
jgi:hypothetical protein